MGGGMDGILYSIVNDGNRTFPYLNDDGERWKLNLNWTDNDLNENGRVARSRTSFYLLNLAQLFFLRAGFEF